MIKANDFQVSKTVLPSLSDCRFEKLSEMRIIFVACLLSTFVRLQNICVDNRLFKCRAFLQELCFRDQQDKSQV